jgi:NitT/TauT family transport system ATP-binding protein
VSKEYPDNKQVIRDLSLTATSGEFVSLLGASGCGKSTLLKMIAGLSATSGGSIHIDGRIPGDARNLMSFVFQDPTLLPWRTVARNVELALEFAGLAKSLRATRIDSVLKLVGLSEVGSYYPRQLSGGMKMRVSIARALATTPRLLLMDEPFAALDEMTRNRLDEDLLALKSRRHWTTLFVTHSITEAVFLSHRVVLMSANPGRVCREIPIPLNFPRTAALRSDPGFLTLVGQVSQALAALHS